MKKTKTWLSLACVLALGIVLAACGGGDKLALTDNYSDATYGYSFKAPANAAKKDDSTAGKISLYWSDPSDLWVNTYVEEGVDEAVTPDLVAAYLEQNFSADIVSQNENSVIAVSTDSDGDTNYTKAIIANGNIYYMDVFYHPADEETMKPVAQALMDSFTV